MIYGGMIIIAANAGGAFSPIGDSNAKPLRKFILEMKSILAPERDFMFGAVPFTGVNLPLNVFDCSLTEKDCGFKAKIPFAEGVQRTAIWVKTQ